MPAPSWLSGAKLLAAADLALVLAEPLRHAIDRYGQIAKLVIAAWPTCHRREIALCNSGGLAAQAMNRPHETSGEQRGDQDHRCYGNRAGRQRRIGGLPHRGRPPLLRIEHYSAPEIVPGPRPMTGVRWLKKTRPPNSTVGRPARSRSPVFTFIVALNGKVPAITL